MNFSVQSASPQLWKKDPCSGSRENDSEDLAGPRSMVDVESSTG